MLNEAMMVSRLESIDGRLDVMNREIGDLCKQNAAMREQLAQLLQLCDGLDKIIENRLYPYGRNGDEI